MTPQSFLPEKLKPAAGLKRGVSNLIKTTMYKQKHLSTQQGSISRFESVL